MQSELRKYEFIDALRGIAILGVLLVHSSQAVAPTNSILLWFMGEGARGVQLFYIASALTLCMSWMARNSSEVSPVRNFFIRRFFRIAPMFYLAILAYVFINGVSPSYWAPNGIQWWFIPATALFLHGFHPETITSVVPGGWSIAVEMTFYLALPFLLRHIKSVRSCLFFLLFSLILSKVNSLVIHHLFSYPDSQQYLLASFAFLNFFGQLPVFIIGILSYQILIKRLPAGEIAITIGIAFALLLLAFLYPLFGVVGSYAGDKALVSSHHVVAGALFATLAIILSYWPTKLVVNRITTTIGKISYSMYLTHFAVLVCFAKFGISEAFQKSNSASLLHFLCVLTVTVIVSSFFYQYIEKNGIALGKYLISKSERELA